MNLTNTQKTRYTNPTLAKSSVGLGGLNICYGTQSTAEKTICGFFVSLSRPFFMMERVGTSQDVLFSVTTVRQPYTFHRPILGGSGDGLKIQSVTERSIMTNISSIATPVAIQTLSFNGIAVKFTDDAYLNATAIAKQFGKVVKDYLKTERTQEYIIALSEAVKMASQSDGKKILSQNDLVIIKKGNSKNFEQGTWLHPKLAIDFARWLNPKFAVWCDMQIEKILKGGVAEPSDKETNYNNQELYQICSGSLNYLMDYVKTLHNLNTVAHSDVLHHQKQFAIQQIHAIIQYCYANNITTPTGKPIFKNGELNFIGGNSVAYGLPMLRLVGLVNY